MLMTLLLVFRSWRVTLLIVLCAVLASYHQLVHTVAYDAVFAVRVLAQRAGLWDRAELHALDVVPRTTLQVPMGRWENATAIVVMLYGHRGYRGQFLWHEQAMRTANPNAIIIIPDLFRGGDASVDDVLDHLRNDLLVTEAVRERLPLVWIGISNGARIAMHAAVRAAESAPKQVLLLLAGPLEGTTRLDLMRAWLPDWIRTRWVSDAFDAEVTYPTPLPKLSAQCDRLRVHVVCAEYDWAVSPPSCRVDSPCQKTFRTPWYGHTSLPQVFVKEYTQIVIQALHNLNRTKPSNQTK